MIAKIGGAVFVIVACERDGFAHLRRMHADPQDTPECGARRPSLRHHWYEVADGDTTRPMCGPCVALACVLEPRLAERVAQRA